MPEYKFFLENTGHRKPVFWHILSTKNFDSKLLAQSKENRIMDYNTDRNNM